MWLGLRIKPLVTWVDEWSGCDFSVTLSRCWTGTLDSSLTIFRNMTINNIVFIINSPYCSHLWLIEMYKFCVQKIQRILILSLVSKLSKFFS